MAFARPATDPTFFGITPRHWQTLVTFARTRGYVIALRAGKRAAVPWIERGFPAKPLALKCKVDPQVGLLFARTLDERVEAERAGYPTLQPVADSRGELLAKLGRNDAFSGYRFQQAREPWAKSDLVIDPATRLPITSDYDLAAVVDTRQADYTLTYASAAGTTNRTNVATRAIADNLNALFGSRRIMHGSEAQYSGSLVHGDEDQVVVFHPNGDVEMVADVPVWRTDIVLHRIILRYFPDKAAWFRQ